MLATVIKANAFIFIGIQFQKTITISVQHPQNLREICKLIMPSVSKSKKLKPMRVK